MATLLKLQICGIRSFGPSDDQQQQISFDTPVTLLVGQNGCGKTTILEAIKFACTSELPSNSSKGQGFVHDPKISDRSITKGYIKLKLIDVKGDTYTINKCVQVQQKATGLSFSSMEFSLSIVKTTGEKTQISSRCMDFDKYCAQILQVSPCIWNDVLFCHQENASWPLDEGKNVKLKFDKIFDSEKYSKCNDVITKIYKAKIDEIKNLKPRVECAKEKVEEVAKKRIRLQDKKDACESITENIGKKCADLEPLSNRMEEIEELEQDIGKLQKQVTSKIAERKGIIQQQNMLMNNISLLFEGPDEQLQSEISSFQHRQREKENIIQSLEKNKREIEKKESQIEAEIQKAQMKLGQLKEEKKQFEMKKNEQDMLFQKSKTFFKLQVPLIWSTAEDSQRAIGTLKLELNAIDANLENTIKSKNKELTDLQDSIAQVREALATAKEKSSSNSIDIRKTKEKILQVTNEIEELDVANNKLIDINRKIKELTKTMNNLQNSFDEAAAEAEIISTKKEISKMESTLEELENLYKILQQNYIIDEKLNTEEQTQIKKKTEFKKIMNKHSQNFAILFDNIPPENIGKKIQNELTVAENEIKRINSEITLKQKEITKLETQIQHQTKDINKYNQEYERNMAEMTAVCQGKDYATIINETYNRKEKLQKEKGQISSAKIMYEAFIDLFVKDKPCCPVCSTDFSGKKSALKDVIDKLKQKIKSLPEKLENIESNLKKEEQLYNKLQQLKPVNENIEIVSNVKLPLLNEELESNQKDLTLLNSQLSKLNEDLKIPSRKSEICRKVLTDATLLDQYSSDIKLCEENRKEYLSQKRRVETTRNKHEVESEIDNLKVDLSEQRKKCDRVRQKLDQHKQRCHKINEEKNQQVELQMKYQTQANKKPHLEKQLGELEDRISILLVDKEEIQSENHKLDKQLETLNKEKNNLVLHNDKLISEKRIEVNKIHKLVDAIIKVNSEINEYVNKNIGNSLEQTINQLAQLEEKKKNCTEVKNKAVDKITEQKEDIAKQVTEVRNLQDNVTLREKKKQEALLVIDITNIEKRIGNYNYQSIHEEKIKLKRQIEKLDKEINNLKGQEMELKNTISDIQQELNMPINKNAEKNCKQMLYELILTQKLTEDLMTYSKALHYSILQFHKEKMVQINERIRELWRNIYKGNDIDYIQIQAEESKGNSKRQTYNYKVVQVKNGTEIEMRGRCSAGQKVLACLIIRMALAESFSSHCGILALDEPTTNLDRENIQSLTYALSNIITAHQNDHNFQLFVITHDQEFLDILRHNVQNISHYFRVTRDPHGFSVIKKERL